MYGSEGPSIFIYSLNKYLMVTDLVPCKSFIELL